MGGEWAESGRSGAETPNFKTYKEMWWKSKKCPNTETKDEKWMGAGLRLGGGWAEAGRSGADTLNFKNAKKIGKMVEIEKMSKHRNKRREMDGSWAEAGRRLGGSGAERGGDTELQKCKENKQNGLKS